MVGYGRRNFDGGAPCTGKREKVEGREEEGRIHRSDLEVGDKVGGKDMCALSLMKIYLYLLIKDGAFLWFFAPSTDI